MATKRITDVDIISSLNSDESFFVNQNSSIKQINKSDIVWGINNGGTGATNADDAIVNLGAAPKQHTHTTMLNGIFLYENWSDSVPYTQDITVDGILKEDYPNVDIDLSEIIEVDDINNIVEEWGYVTRCFVKENNVITAYCYKDVPTVNIPVIFKVVR